MFRFPFIKNRYFDGHFDLTEPGHLVGKSMEWLSWHLKLPMDGGDEQQRRRNSALITATNLVGLAMQRKFADAERKMAELDKNGFFGSKKEAFARFTSFKVIKKYSCPPYVC